LLVVAIVTVALLVGDRLVIGPLAKVWKERQVELVRLRKDVTEGGVLVDREAALRERWQAMQTHTFSNETSAAENQMLKAFDQWSRDSLVSVTSVKPQWRRDDEDYLTLDCRVDASGSLSGLTRFLYELEKDPLALKVDMVEIISRDESGAQLTLGLQVSGLLISQVTER
jgi:hypothetical protein